MPEIVDTVWGFDLATKCGWCSWSNGIYGNSGTLAMKPATRFQELWHLLHRMEKISGAPDHVIYEVLGVLHGKAKKVLVGMQAIVELYCLESGTEIHTVSPTALKKFATGNGRAEKIDMVAAAGRRWPFRSFNTDDEVDALWATEKHLVDLGIKELEHSIPEKCT